MLADSSRTKLSGRLDPEVHLEHEQLHGLGSHVLAAMIAFIQGETLSVWSRKVAAWIRDLSETDPSWSPEEPLFEVGIDERRGIASLRSTHRREKGLPDIEIRHLWVVMPPELPS
jgi:hypothetical protein